MTCFLQTLCTFASANGTRGVAQLVSAPRSGRGGRKFESSHPDTNKKDNYPMRGGCPFLCYFYYSPRAIRLRMRLRVSCEILRYCDMYLRGICAIMLFPRILIYC